MTYILEWRADEDDRDPYCLVRHVRVFRDSGGLKAFLRSRAFRRLASREVRLQHRARDQRPDAVITTVAGALAWDPAAARLPPALVSSEWAEALAAISLRGHLLERLSAELGTAQRLHLLTSAQAETLIQSLREMLALPDRPRGR